MWTLIVRGRASRAASWSDAIRQARRHTQDSKIGDTMTIARDGRSQTILTVFARRSGRRYLMWTVGSGEVVSQFGVTVEALARLPQGL